LQLLFAWRYFKAKKSTNAINIIAWTSITAIIVGTTALILVLSVFNGFEGLVKSLYSSFYTDLKIVPAKGKTMKVSDEQIQKLKTIDGIRNFSRVLEQKALIQNGEDNQSVVNLKGVDENYRYVTGVEKSIVNGVYELGNEEHPKLVLGAGVEGALGIVADRNIYLLKIYLPRKGKTEQVNLADDISNDTIRSSAAFMIQQEFDSKYAITNIDFVKKSSRIAPDEYSGIEITLNDAGAASSVSRQIGKVFGPQYQIQDKYQQNKSLYSIMNLERWAIFAIATLILMVAAFNMIGALRMLSLEKQKDIAALHAMGATRWFIQKIFLLEGVLLALIGGGVGMLLALGIALLQIKFELIKLEGGSFLINYFPIKLRLSDFLLVGATVFFIAILASWLPSRRAAAQGYSLRSE
jgi:lipoprotein-releasing system permease protein